MHIKALLLFSLLSHLLIQSVFALEVPKLTGPVVDLAHVLTNNEKQQISNSLLNFKQQYGPQLQLLTIPTLDDETIESYSIKVVNEWKLGSKLKDDGVLLLIAVEERRMRIEVGYGLEGNLTDAMAGRIIRTGITPYFKQQKMSAGIISGLDLIAQAVGDELSDMPDIPNIKSKKNNNLKSLIFIIFIFIFIIIPKFMKRHKKQGLGGTIVDGILIDSALRNNQHNSERSGGGFGGVFGGGGGGFGGGGASGGW